ncbi:MAG TPA: FtsX-like permease family protein [Ilumatobacteraceae bacterium]|nr:FtsX-like permease family protein [Ilumatobacteraceae bacterium]
MTFALIVATTQADTAQERFERVAGQSDFYAMSFGEDVEPVQGALPNGSRAVTMTFLGTRLTVSDDVTTPYAEFQIVPFADPLVEGIFEVRDGRAPAASGEVLLHADVARDLGVGVGDSFELDRPSGTWTVVGIGRATDDFNRRFFAVSEFPEERITPGFANMTLLVDLPADVTSAQLADLAQVRSENGFATLAPDMRSQTGDLPGWFAFDQEPSDVSGEALAWGWVAGALALAAVGVIIAAAFASSARRQLTTIGQLAANGAPERLVQGTLAFQGAWTGLIGSVVGVTIALVALPLSRSLVEQLVARRLGPWDIDITALAVICLTGVAAATIAAMIPARSAARIPVLAALAGRRPLGAVPRRLVPIGLTSFAAGIGLLVLVTAATTSGDGHSDDSIYSVAALIGGLLVLGGMCCASPIAVDLIGRVGARLRGSWRLAARSVARSRTRSAGVLTAIAVTGTAAIAITTAVGSVAFGDENDTPIVPRDTVVLTSIRLDWTPPPGVDPDEYVAPVADVVPLDDELVARVTRVVPDAEISPRRVVVPDWPVDLRQTTPPSLPPTVLVADDTIRELLGLSERDTEAFDRAGVLDTSVWYSGSDTGPAPQDYTVTVPTASGDRTVEVVIPKDRLGSRGGEWGGVITEDLAAELGLDVVDAGLVLRAPAELTRDQRDALGDIQNDLWQGENIDSFVEPGDDPAIERSENYVSLEQRVTYESVPITFPRALLDATALAAALLLTLMVVAIGLSLAATESRDERDVLLAVGATLRTMRSVAATKAVVLTAGAATLAIPTGFLPVLAVLKAAPDDNQITFPWLTALGLLIIIPVIAGVTALLTSATAQRLRPVHMSTLTED